VVHLAIHPCGKPQGILAKANKPEYWSIGVLVKKKNKLKNLQGFSVRRLIETVKK